ncbi:MAG: type IV pili methyl-accepting chemotaxis transducer N-terminal domain-containing protein [Caldimonas sp.]
MKSALVVDSASPSVPDLTADLAAVGIHVLGACSRHTLVREAIRLNPALIVCHEVSVDESLFEACALLASTAPCAVVVFTNDPDVAKIERALTSGIHGYEINGYGMNRLRSVMHLAEARFRHERALLDELADVGKRFDERKLVDRAKGILMRARQLSEEDAFRVLRTASMHSNRRVGQVSQQVIDAAHYAEAVNRAGKLRMLAQRLVKLRALRLIDPAGAPGAQLLDESITAIDANIAALTKSLSKATFGDLLEAVETAWPPVRSLVLGPVLGPALASDGAPLIELDRLAEHLLLQADQLTRHLETAGLVTTLHVINVSGRQRMWSQRFAKQALLGVLLTGEPAQQARDEMLKTALAFEQAMDYLKTIPLGNREIREALGTAEREWATLRQASEQVKSAAGLRALADSSEALLALFEHLTDQYERSMQVLMG